ncbi:unnamed protein product [Rhizoctonia solani]|uniref:Uncharacterized protein n=1 Tax=Rhizoctonia solani TaxID=456999 RepID=A0A8H2Y042_9AGAM|nr:unnamed protein product [Rhizoctonia solani]
MAGLWLRSKNQIVRCMAHCIIQGILIPLLANFLTSSHLKRDKPWFKSYVIYVNALALIQTAVEIYGVLDYLDSRSIKVSPIILVLSPTLNVGLSASVQLFFIFRCWRIYEQRALFVLPLLALWLTALIPGLMTGYYLVETLRRSTIQPASIAMAIWTFSSLLLELCVTVTTVVFLFRSRTGLVEHNGLFKIVWQVTWVSAALPPILMVILSINGYIVNNLTHPITVTAADLMGAYMRYLLAEFNLTSPTRNLGKVYTLSLMITIAGKGLIRARLDGSSLKDRLTTVLTATGDIPMVVVIPTESSAYEMESRGPTTNTLHGTGSDCENGYPYDSIQVDREWFRKCWDMCPPSPPSEMISLVDSTSA